MRHHASVFACRAIVACTLGSGLTLAMDGARAEGLLRTSSTRPAPVSGQVGIEPAPATGPRVSTAREVPAPKDWQDVPVSPQAPQPAAQAAAPRTDADTLPIADPRPSPAQKRMAQADRAGARSLALKPAGPPVRAGQAPRARDLAVNGKAIRTAKAKVKEKATSKAHVVASRGVQAPGRKLAKTQQAAPRPQKVTSAKRLTAPRAAQAGKPTHVGTAKMAKAVSAAKAAKAIKVTKAPRAGKAAATSASPAPVARRASLSAQRVAKAQAKTKTKTQTQRAQARASAKASAATPRARTPAALKARRPVAKLAQAD